MERVAQLEKKHSHLAQTVANWKVPEVSNGGGNVDSQAVKNLQERVERLEAGFDGLRAEFSHWMKLI